MSPDIHRAVALRQYLRIASPSSPIRFKGAMGVIFNEIMDEYPSEDCTRRNLTQIFEDVSKEKERTVYEIEGKYNYLSGKYVKLIETNMKISDRNSKMESEMKELKLRLALERLKSTRRIKKIKNERKREYIEREVDSYEHKWMRDVFRPRNDSNVSQESHFPSEREEEDEEDRDTNRDLDPEDKEEDQHHHHYDKLKGCSHFPAETFEAYDMPM